MAQKPANVFGNPELWERQPGETIKGYDAFCRYRDLPAHSRSVYEAAIKFDTKFTRKDRMPPRQWTEWQSKYHWVDRAAAWDSELDRKKREKQQEEIEKMAQRHASQVQAMLTALLQPATAVLQRMKNDPKAMQEQLNEKHIADLINLIVGAGKVVPGLVNAERLSRGVSTENVSLTVGDKAEGAKHDGAEFLVIEDPEAADLFNQAFQRLAVGKSNASRVRMGSESETMEDAGPPGSTK